jgi:hypothetical protein
LAAAALEEVILPTSQEIDGMYVFDYGVRNALSEYTVTDILRGIEGATNLLDEYGDMYVERHDSRYDLIVELCTAWSIDYEEWGGGIYIYRGQLNPVDIRDAVREILLNHPGMFRTTNKDIRSTSSTEEYKKDIREWGDIQSIPMWSLKDMFQDKEVLRTGLPEAEIAVDLTGAMVMYPDGSKELIRVRQRSDPGTAQEYLTILKELCDRVWKQGGFVSRWGKHMWEHYGIRSVFFTRTPPVFDTMRDAIAYLEKLVKIKEKE